MALINHAKKEINAKLVYFGPAGAGKEASLTAIYRKLKPGCRGELKSMALQDSNMLFFDFVPPGQDSPSGFRVRFHLYTLVDTVASPSHWNLLLKGVDGLVFVADSTDGRMVDNRQSLLLLEDCLSSFGTGLDTIPCILQYNKRDGESALPLDELERSLNPKGRPALPTSADRGEGVVDVLARLVRGVMRKLHDSAPETLGEEIELQREETAPSALSQRGVPMETSPGLDAADVDEVAAASTAGVAEVASVGLPEVVAGGKIRIPLHLRHGDQDRHLTITVAISLDEG